MHSPPVIGRGEARILVGLVLRYSPLYHDLLAARDAGQLGEITSIEATEHIKPYHGAFFQRDRCRDSIFPECTGRHISPDVASRAERMRRDKA